MVGVVYSWSLTPRLKNPTLLNAAKQTAVLRFQESQALAHDVQKNGYLNELFLPYWGSPSHYQAKCRARRTVEAWLGVSANADGTWIEHAKKLASQDADYLAKRSDFASLLGELRKVVKTGHFVVPNTRVDDHVERLDFESLQALSSALVHYSSSLKSERRFQEAADALALNLALAKVTYGQTIIDDINAQQLQSTTFKSVVHDWTSGSGVPSAAWFTLSRAFQEHSPSSDQFLLALKMESMFYERIVNDIITGRSNISATSIPPTFYFPGGIERERRIALNFFTDMMEDAVSAPYSEALKVSRFTWVGWFAGTSGRVTELLSGYEDWKEDNNYHRLLMHGTAVALYLRGLEAENGKLPDDLDHLEKNGFQWDSQIPKSFFEFDREQRLLSLKAPNVFPEIAHGLINSSEYASKPGVEILSDRIAFKI